MRYRRRLYGLQLTDARSVFEAMDRDGDGTLSRNEFEKALNRLGMGLTSTQIHALVTVVGSSVDDTIPFEKFLEMLGTGVVEEGANVEHAAAAATHNDGRPSHSNPRHIAAPDTFSDQAKLTRDVNTLSSEEGRTETTRIRPKMTTTTILHHRNVRPKVDSNNHSSVAAPSRRASQPPSAAMVAARTTGFNLPTGKPTTKKQIKPKHKRKHKRVNTMAGDPRSGHVVIQASPRGRDILEFPTDERAIEEEGAERGNSQWILRRNSLTTATRTGHLEYLEKRVPKKQQPKMDVQEIPIYLGVPKKEVRASPTVSRSPEFVRVGGLYRRKTDPMKRAAAIKASLSPTVAQQVLAKQRAEASTSKRDLEAEQIRLRQNRRGSFNGVVKVEMENQKTVRSRRASYVVKSDAERSERRRAAMAKHAREVRQREASRARLQARKSATKKSKRVQRSSATNNSTANSTTNSMTSNRTSSTASSTTNTITARFARKSAPRNDRSGSRGGNRGGSSLGASKWNSGTKIRKTHNMISNPSGDTSTTTFLQNHSSPKDNTREKHSRKRKTTDSRSSANGGHNSTNNNRSPTASYVDVHNTYVPYVPGSERNVNRKQSEAASILVNILDSCGVPLNAHLDVVESIRASFEGFDSRGTGMVGVGDVRQSLVRLNLLDDDEADCVCGVVRTDRDGFVHYPEFLVALRAAMKESTAPMSLSPPASPSNSAAVTSEKQLQERQRIMRELIKLGIDFEEAQVFGDDIGTKASFRDGGVEGEEQEMFAPSNILDPRLNKSYGNPYSLTMSINGDKDELKNTIQKWKLLQKEKGGAIDSNSSNGKKSTMRQRLEALSNVRTYSGDVMFKEKKNEQEKMETERRGREDGQPPWKRWKQSRSISSVGTSRIGATNSSVTVNPQEEAAEETPARSRVRSGSVVKLAREGIGGPRWIYDINTIEDDDDDDDDDDDYDYDYGSDRGERMITTTKYKKNMTSGHLKYKNSIVVTMSEAAVIHYQVSTLSRCFNVLRDHADRTSWEREMIVTFHMRQGQRMVPQALSNWKKAHRAARYWTLRTSSKYLETWLNHVHEQKNIKKQLDIAQVYYNLRRQVWFFRMWREKSALSTVGKHLEKTASMHYRTTLLRKGFNAIVERCQREEVWTILDNRALLHYARTLARNILQSWRLVVVERQRMGYYGIMADHRLLAKMFTMLRYGVEMSIDDRKQMLHSNVYRRLFLLSRAFQQWQTFLQESQRDKWALTIYEGTLLRQTLKLWRKQVHAWMSERYRYEASDILWEMAVKRRYFVGWNDLIHDKYWNNLAKNLSDHLDRSYAVKQWHRWSKAQLHSRRLADIGRKYFLMRHVRTWRTHTRHALAELHADIHWRKVAKRSALLWLQKAAQDRVELRGKKNVAEDHYITHTLSSTMQKWMDHMRGKQELRGKMNQAEDYARTRTLRIAFNRIGQPIMKYKGKEMLAHQLRDLHRTRRMAVSMIWFYFLCAYFVVNINYLSVVCCLLFADLELFFLFSFDLACTPFLEMVVHPS